MNVQKLAQRLSDEARTLSESLVTSPSSTLEEYRERVGRVRGLQQALDILGEILNDDN